MRPAISFALLHTLPLCGALALGGAPAVVETAPIEVPFTLESNKIVIQVSINGSSPIGVAVDTGMVDGILLNDPALARELKLAPTGRITVQGGGAGAPVKAAVAYGAEIGLGAASLRWQPVVIMPRGSEYVRLSRCAPFRGVIGHSVFHRWVVEIDHDRQRLVLHEPRSFRHDGAGVELPLGLEDKKPYVCGIAALPGGARVPVKLMVDTGAGGGLYLNAGTDPRIVTPADGIETILGRGVLGKRRGRLGRIPALALGETQLENLIVAYPDAPMKGLAPDRNGLLGNEVLSRFNAIFDYGRKRLILEPNGHHGEPFDYDMVGLQFDPGDDASCPLRVDDVVDGSPAKAAGIRLGDVLVAVDGRPVEEFSRSELLRLFRGEPGRELRLELRRGHHAIEVTVRLERLL